MEFSPQERRALERAIMLAIASGERFIVADSTTVDAKKIVEALSRGEKVLSVLDDETFK